MRIPLLDVQYVVGNLIVFGLFKATKYLSDKQVIRATRKTYGRKICKSDNIEIILTIGKPNFAERKFIKDCLKAGEKFPVRKMQFTHFPKKRG